MVIINSLLIILAGVALIIYCTIKLKKIILEAKGIDDLRLIIVMLAASVPFIGIIFGVVLIIIGFDS